MTEINEPTKKLKSNEKVFLVKAVESDTFDGFRIQWNKRFYEDIEWVELTPSDISQLKQVLEWDLKTIPKETQNYDIDKNLLKKLSEVSK